MNKEELDLLIKAGNNFYLGIGKNPGITDDHYDKLKEKYESETGLSVMELFDFPKDKSGTVPLITPLTKVKLMADEIKPAIKEFVGDSPHIINYKHDGSSILGIYKDGILVDIKSTPSDPSQACRMKNFYEFFPHRLEDKTIKYIAGEVLTSTLEYGEKARQNANAAVNSKRNEKIRELKKHAFIRAYYVVHEDELYYFGRLVDDLNKLKKYNSKLFKVAENLHFNEITTDSYSVTTPLYGDHIMIDGYVVYKPGEIKGFKFKCMDYVDVEVSDINYEYREDTGNYVPTIKFEPFLYQGTERRSVNPGGISVVLNDGLNIGSTFRYVGIGNTTPGIGKDKDDNRIIYTHGDGYIPFSELKSRKDRNLITKEIYRFPECDCGTQLSIDGLLDSNLYCMNPYCMKRLNSMKKRFSSISSLDDPIRVIFELVHASGVTENKYNDVIKYNSNKGSEFIEKLSSTSICSNTNHPVDFNEWIELVEPEREFTFDSEVDLVTEFMNIYKDAFSNDDKCKLFELGLRAALLIVKRLIMI